MKFNRLLSLAFLAFFFTTSSAFASIELLMVGAGGAGGGMGGGAGGEVIYEASHAVIVQSYSVQVGQGGAGGRYFGGGAPVAGTASTFDGLTATPGGYGGDVVNQQNTCTNGGGDGSSLGSGGCASSVGQGTGGNSPSGGQGGGGGGYSGNGQNGNSTIAGSGGTGYTSSISGSSIQYACGGGGGTYNTNTRGLAGCSTAGNGSGGTTAPTAGTDGTGSGGGGASGVTYQTAGAGGDGVVIIKYLTGTVTATGGTITYSGSYTIHTFTADGTFVVTAVAGGGNGGSTVSAEIVTPATLYSSQLIQSPVSTSTYTFTSTIASSTLKQAGVVFIVRATSSSPTITWGGTAMTYLLSTDSDLYNVTDLFIINNPTTTASIVVSGISASSTKYISQSVWSNANLHSVVDEYTVIPGVSKASVSLPSVTVPTTILSSMYTVTGLEAYTLLSSSVVIHSATSSTGSFSIQRSSCASFLDECSVGYTKNFTLFDSTNGYLVGVNLYSTSTVSASAEEIGNSIIGSHGC